MLPERATIGGVLATNSNGPMRAGFGGVRDYCIGVNFVTGDGKIAKGGGRVVKNVAGYDMMKLMIGSMGSLGIMTSANFKVFPLPQQTCTFVCECADLTEAIAFRDRVVSSPLSPMCLELISPRAQEYLIEQPDVRDPDHYAPLAGLKPSQPWQVVVRAGGSDAVLKRYRTELGSAVTRDVTGKQESDLWRAISDFEEKILERHRNAMVVNVSVTISGAQQAYEAAEQSAVEHNLLSACVGRATVGSLVFAFMPLGVDPPSAMQFANVASSLRGRLPKDVSAVVVRCPREAKDRFNVWGTSPNDLAIMRGVRAAMDPKRVLNRGRFIV
jgi:glycolate oxidase FAD binding subunit